MAPLRPEVHASSTSPLSRIDWEGAWESKRMRDLLRAGVLVAITVGGAGFAAADVMYEAVVRTADSLTRGTAELEDTVTVSVRGDRIRQEMRGVRSVLTRRGARYEKPGHRVTLDQVDRGLRYEINLDAETYVEEPFTSTRVHHEETIAAAEKVLGIGPATPLPALAVSIQRPGERQQVHGRECERVVIRATKELTLVTTRGAGRAGPEPVRFEMTHDLCLAPDLPPMREVRAIEERVEDLTGMRGPLADRQLRVFEARRDVLAVFELMQRLLEREQQRLSGVPVKWERTFVGSRRDQPQVTLFRHTGEVTRIETQPLDPRDFELPPGLTLDPRRLSADRSPAP
jgi:hypothetical protein